MHISSYHSLSNQYYMDEFYALDNSNIIALEQTTTKRDFSVQITCDLKPSEQSEKAAYKANSILGMLTRSFVFRDSELWKRMKKL